jgi:diacylglycerol kinase
VNDPGAPCVDACLPIARAADDSKWLRYALSGNSGQTQSERTEVLVALLIIFALIGGATINNWLFLIIVIAVVLSLIGAF